MMGVNVTRMILQDHKIGLKFVLVVRRSSDRTLLRAEIMGRAITLSQGGQHSLGKRGRIKVHRHSSAQGMSGPVS